MGVVLASPPPPHLEGWSGHLLRELQGWPDQTLQGALNWGLVWPPTPHMKVSGMQRGKTHLLCHHFFKFLKLFFLFLLSCVQLMWHIGTWGIILLGFILLFIYMTKIPSVIQMADGPNDQIDKREVQVPVLLLFETDGAF